MKEKVIKALSLALEKINLQGPITLTNPKGHADYATNIAMQYAKSLKINPLELAQKICDNVESDFIKKIEVVAPGFINIFLHENSYQEIVQNILNQKSNFGKANQGKFINVEYVSANPTGYLHIGHASNAALGASLSAILKFAGNRVDQEYYVNDGGNQISILGFSTFIRYQQLLGKKVGLPKSAYHGDEIINVAKLMVKNYQGQYLHKDYEKVQDIFESEAKNYMLKKIVEHLHLFGVKMDIYFSEKSLYEHNKIMKSLQKIPSLYKKDGATWIATTKYGDDKDRVLIKKDGQFTYFAPDIAYHDIKISRGYDELINIWGADHIGYITKMKIALQELGLPSEKLDILTIQMVKLVKNGEEFKMSKRSGTSFTLKELIDLVGKDAARFYLVNRSPGSKLDFDIELATKRNNDNPVFTLQYTHARAHQLLKKSTKIPLVGNYEDKEITIINLLKQFPDLITKIANNHRVYLLPKYLIELAQSFNSFYSNSKIINSAREQALIALTMATKQVLATGLDLLGVNAPEKM